MKRLLVFFVGLLPALAGAGNGTHLCVWGSACTFPVDIYETDGIDYATTAAITIPAGDIEWYCPGQAVDSTSSSMAEISPRGFVLTVPASLTDCARFEMKVRDQDATAAYLAMSAHVETCGNASAAHVNCTSALSTLVAADIVTGGAITTSGGAVSNVTTVATTTTNTDMRGTDGASTHAPTAIVTSGAINTSGGAVTTVTNATNLQSLNANAQGQVTAAATQSSTNLRLNELMNSALSAQPAAGSLHGDLTEDDPGAPGTQRFTAAALAQAPSGGGGGDVNVNSWGGVLLTTTNPLPNAVPGANGGLPTVDAGGRLAQETVVAQNNDKGGYSATTTAYDGGLSFNTNQENQINAQALAALDSRRLNELMSTALASQPQAGSIFGDLTQDSTTIPGTQQFTPDALAQAPTSSTLDAEQLRLALGGFSGLITSVVNPTTFILDNGPAIADSINNEFTAIFEDTSDSNLPVCHRKVQDWTAGSQLVIDTACPAGYTQVNGDRVIVLPNGTGAIVEAINVNNGAVETDLTVQVDGTLSLGCMLSAINAVETGAQTVVGGTDYTYRNPGDTENRVVASRTASGRTQATITCPAGL